MKTAASPPDFSVLLVTGGSGGHVFPALAALECPVLHSARAVLLIDRRGLRYLPPKAQTGAAQQIRVVNAAAAPQTLWTLVVMLLRLPLLTFEAARTLRALRPRVVLSFGSHVAVPYILAAFMLRLPLILHEQNAVLGRVNRWGLPFATRLALSFRKTAGAERHGKAVVTGNPVRSVFARIRRRREIGEGEERRLALLVIGGSQGATALTRILPRAVAYLSSSLRRRLHVTQQGRQWELASLRAAYARLQVTAHCQSFFSDMAERLAAADLLIARCGASMLWEAAACGTPAVYIPYPHAGGHQYANAAAATSAKAAWVVKENSRAARSLASLLSGFLSNPAPLAAAAAAASAFARPQAAETLAKVALKTAGFKPHAPTAISGREA